MWVAESTQLRVFSLKGDISAEYSLPLDTTSTSPDLKVAYRGGMLFSSAGQLWIGGVGKIAVFDCRRQKIAKQLSATSGNKSVKIVTVAQQRVATACSDGNLLVWDAQSFDLLQTVKHVSAVSQCVFLNSSSLHLTSAADGKIRIWDSQFALLRTVSGRGKEEREKKKKKRERGTERERERIRERAMRSRRRKRGKRREKEDSKDRETGRRKGSGISERQKERMREPERNTTQTS
jgi:hypothetical protein